MIKPRLSPSLVAMSLALALGGCAGAVQTQTSVQAAAVAPPAASVVFWQGFRDHPHGYLTAANTPNAANFLPPAPGVSISLSARAMAQRSDPSSARMAR